MENPPQKPNPFDPYSMFRNRRRIFNLRKQVEARERQVLATTSLKDIIGKKVL
jgi:hypothetical protein